MQSYDFISKTIFFPEQGILVVGDLHLGFGYMIQQSGVLIPERQVEEIISELNEIIKKIESQKNKLKKIIFLGDIKHSFSYEWKEKNYFNEIMNFLKNYVEEENIIFIRGNHDTIDYSFNHKLKDYFIDGEIAFLHGHKMFLEVFDSKIKTIVMGHLHPSVILSEKTGVKHERFKCFLVGKFKKKELIILPSFLSTIEGTAVNDLESTYKDFFSIVPKKDMMNFSVFVVGENKTFEFGKVKNLN